MKVWHINLEYRLEVIQGSARYHHSPTETSYVTTYAVSQ